MAKRWEDRAQLDRLLDPDNPSATLATLVKAANAVGKREKISLVSAEDGRDISDCRSRPIAVLPRSAQNGTKQT